MEDDDQTGTGSGAADAGPVIRAFVEGDTARLRPVLHPDVEVRLSAFAEPDLWLRGREAVLRWYRRTAGSHRAYLHRVQEAVPAVWLAFGRMQITEPERGMRDYQVVWMVAIRDGLVWRASSHETEAQARAAVSSPRP